MAAPTDAAQATTDGSTSTTSQTLNLPGGIASGDLLVAHIRSPGATTFTFPAGWTQIRNASPDGADDQLGIFYRTADGTEGATITVTLSSAARMSGIVWLITGTATLVFEDAAGTTGTSSQPNPINTALGGGVARDVLWLTLASGESTRTLTNPPTNYVNGTISAHTGGNGTTTSCYVAGATRQVNSDLAEDAGAWTLDANSTWSAYTFAIYTGAPELRLSQAPVEAAIFPDNSSLRLSQAPVEVIIDQGGSQLRLSQAPVEVLIQIPPITAAFRAYVID